jgi:hypothetical protein
MAQVQRSVASWRLALRGEASDIYALRSGRWERRWNKAAGSHKSGRAGFTKGMNSKNFDPPRQGWTPEYQKSQEGLIGRVFDVS